MALDETATLLIGLLALVVLFPVFMMALVMPFGTMMMGTTYGTYTGGWYALFAIVPFVLLLLIGWVAYRFLSDENGEDPAVGELREAYARGDLTSEEFEERLERLSE
jgi:putative membrane protein